MDYILKYKSVRQKTLDLSDHLNEEDMVVQPIEDVSPTKWHLGHTTWFFETFILLPHKKDFELFNANYPFLFNSYYESAGERILRATRGNLTQPYLNEIIRYREYIDSHMLEFLNSSAFKDEYQYMVEVGLNHEQQHQELLLTDIKYVLGHNPLFPTYQKNIIQINDFIKDESFSEIKEGVYFVGHQNDGFCYDNELGIHQIYLQSFKIRNSLITNREYLEFMNDGGYQKFHFWLSEGWDWVNKNNIQAPLYWNFSNKEWVYYTLNGLRPIDLDAPVSHISYFEADAFASWKGMRLPTEFEWEVAVKEIHKTIPENANFLDKNILMPVPAYKNNQLYGDVWEWTASSYLPYPYYKKADGALGEYNGKFMINQMVLRGGSVATPVSHIRSSYRNFFQTNKRWQFTGIRLVDYL
jgi:ergothioneine biosynthesis protein EgtB